MKISSFFLIIIIFYLTIVESGSQVIVENKLENKIYLGTDKIRDLGIRLPNCDEPLKIEGGISMTIYDGKMPRIFFPEGKYIEMEKDGSWYHECIGKRGAGNSG